MKEQDIVGLSDRDIFPEGMADEFVLADKQFVATGQPVFNIGEHILDRNGTLNWYITEKHPIFSAGGKVAGLMGISRNPEVPETDHVPGNAMDRVMRYMQDHFRENISMQFLADLVHVSRRQFHRMFKLHFGIPPHQFVIRLRISAAEEYLLADWGSVSEIGMSLGFSDETLFIRHFKKRTGESPHKFRKARRSLPFRVS